MASVRLFGEVPGVAVGSVYASRAALAAAGIHRPLVAGISGGGAEGADSIVLNGGYEDDKDYGDEVVYTGHGGNDPATGRQIADQTLTVGNKALAKNSLDGLPVRVSRGWKEPHGFGPESGFRYDGLYRVVRYWSERGRSGFRIWRFLLRREDSAPAPWLTRAQTDDVNGTVSRELITQRWIRNSATAQHVKQLNDFRCQLCGIQLQTAAGPYAEGANLRPVEHPHDGPDDPANILCVCPNDHIRLDAGGIVIMDDFTVVDRLDGRPIGKLLQVRGHRVDEKHIAYHRQLFMAADG